MNPPHGAWRIFRIPLLLAVVSGAGLIGALLGRELADAGWTLAVATPLVAIGWALACRRR